MDQRENSAFAYTWLLVLILSNSRITAHEPPSPSQDERPQFIARSTSITPQEQAVFLTQAQERYAQDVPLGSISSLYFYQERDPNGCLRTRIVRPLPNRKSE